MKLSVTAVVLVRGKVNNDSLTSWLWSCFVSSSKQISAAARIRESAQFVSEVTGLKMSAEIKKKWEWWRRREKRKIQ